MLAAAVVTAAVAAPGSCAKAECVERVAARWCEERGRITSCIHRAALHHEQSFGDLLRVARCESRLDPHAVGFGVHFGLFQFLRSTWHSLPRYRSRPILSAKWNSLAAAYMWRIGRRNEWACK